MDAAAIDTGPAVPMWQINILRLFYALIGLIMGRMIWTQIIFYSAEMPVMTGAAKALLAALTLMCLLGLRYPLKMLPMLVFEVTWKTIWILLIAVPAWADGRLTPDIESLFWECSPVFVMYVIMPWRYLWYHYAKPPGEPWRTPPQGSSKLASP